MSALSLFYKLNDFGQLEYAYAVPFVGSPGKSQVSVFNSFIQHISSGEIFNSSAQSVSASITVVDLSGKSLAMLQRTLSPHSSDRLDFQLPSDTFGTIRITGSVPGIVFRNYVSRPGVYVLPFRGK